MADSVKMVVTDMDRTLLRSDKTVSPYTIGVFKRLHEQGMALALATARPLRSVQPYLNHIRFSGLVLNNGAQAMARGESLYYRGIPPQDVRRTLLAIQKAHPEATLSVEIDNVFYANFPVDPVWNHGPVIRTDFTDLPEKPAEKMLIGATSQESLALYRPYLPKDCYIQLSDGRLGLVMHREASKLNGILALSAYFGIGLCHMAAFGDDENDTAMLKACGIGVAMGNACMEARAAADDTAFTSDEDGVARWLETHLL